MTLNLIKILGIFGLSTSLFLLYILKSSKLICSNTCQIINSDHAYIFSKFGIVKKNGNFDINDIWYGLIFYTLFILVSNITFLKVLIIFGILASIIKIYAMFFILKKVCKYCMFIHFINFYLLLILYLN